MNANPALLLAAICQESSPRQTGHSAECDTAPVDRRIQASLLDVIHLSCTNGRQHQLLLSMSDSHRSSIRDGKSSTPSALALKKCPDACTYLAKLTKICTKWSPSFPNRIISVNADSKIISRTTWNCHFSRPKTVNYQQFHMVETKSINSGLHQNWHLLN